MGKIVDSVNLFFREGKSDKVYTAAIEQVDSPTGGFIVTFAFGRRGSTLQTGTKTDSPVTFAGARKIFDKLVAEKLGKGYQHGGTAPAMQQPAPLPEVFLDADPANADWTKKPKVGGNVPVSGRGVQLLTPITRADADRFLADDRFGAQPKLDGKRMQIGRANGSMFALNRSGKPCGFPDLVASALSLTSALSQFAREFLLDGECIGDTYWAFDLLEIGGRNVRDLPCSDRHEELVEYGRGLVEGCGVEIVPLARTTRQKREMLKLIEQHCGEGIVFKRLAARYTVGRGNDQYKLKLWQTATCRVRSVNVQSSVELEMPDAKGRWMHVGGVTVKANQKKPRVGELVEVKYLHAFRESGHLYQTELLRVRDDVKCDRTTSLKYKNGG